MDEEKELLYEDYGISAENKLMKDLLAFIRENNLKSGDKLPPIRVLSEHFNTTQSQMRTALLRLEALGVLMIQPRSGCYVKNISLDSMLQTFCLLFETAMTNEMSLIELYDLKTAIESTIAKQVALIRTEGELLSIKSILQQQEEAADRDERVALDEKYHLHLAQISRNPFFYAILSAIQSILRNARREYPDYDDMYEQIVSDHNKIYIAIKERNENDAYYYASIHSNRRKDRLLSYC